MTRYLVDTDWAIEYLTGQPRAVRVLQAIPRERLSISVVSLGEIYDGIVGGREPEKALAVLNKFLARLTILDVTHETSRLFGHHRAKLRQRGLLIDSSDIFIAATCLQHGLRIFTNNVDHFNRIEGLEIGLAEGDGAASPPQ